MKKLMIVALAAASCSAFAGMDDAKLKADVTGFYDITLTTKSLKHVEKTQSKTFSTSKTKGSAEKQFADYLASVTNNPGFKEVSINATEKDGAVTKIAYKCSWFQQDNNGAFKTKVVSETSTGLFDTSSGKVYLWDKKQKVELNKDVAIKGAKISKDVAKGYVAYEVPLALAGNFIKTDDNKAAAGIVGGTAVAKNAEKTVLDFTAVKGFGTGTYDAKNKCVKTVSGNVASFDSKDVKYGCYGTWKLNRDTKKYDNLEAALVKKGCVELIEEAAE